MLHLTRQVPSLRARQVEKQDRWAARLADVLADRIGVDASADLRPRLYAATALSALDVAVSHWDSAATAQPLGEVLDRAFATAFTAAADDVEGPARRR
jgi:hypothetical protein